MNDQFAAGSVFAGHRIEKVVARGGMGVICATQLRPARPVALKLVAPALLEDSTHRERFKRESEIAASIDHPNVIPIYQTGDEGGLMFIAMRWVEGTDLAALLAEGDRSIPVARRISSHRWRQHSTPRMLMASCTGT